MSQRRTQVPAIPEIAGTPEAIDRTLRALKEATEVGHGRRGDPLDRFVTLRDLRDGGLARVSIQPGGGAVLSGGGSDGGDGATLPDDVGRPDYGENDYTAPPAPKNVRARGMPPELDSANRSLGAVMLTWDAPGYHNHYYAEIYRMARGDHPVDHTGAPLILLEQAGLRPAYAYGVDRGDGVSNGFDPGAKPVFVGVASGTIFLDKGLPEISENPSQDDLESALNPGRYYYWVRFVSTAMVPGPLSDRAEARLSINPALVLDAMTANVSNSAIFRHLRQWLALGSEEAQRGGTILQYVDHAIEGSGINSIWSVRMQHETQTGLIFSAGFGLGMETDQDTGRSKSVFAVRANQFCVFGNTNGAPGARIIGLSGGGYQIRLTLQTWQHGFRNGMVVVVQGPSGQVRENKDAQPFPPHEYQNPFPQISGINAVISSVSGQDVVIERQDGASWPVIHQVFSSSNQGSVRRFNAALFPADNVPFIVDTVTGTVGVRGRLVVDGLVRATEGEFNELRADTAFIRKLQAEVVNANVVIGQRIIAGAPNIGPIDAAQYSGISNYIIEMNNPVTSEYPLRFWKPSDNRDALRLDRLGNIYVSGNMSVGGSGVFAGEASGEDSVIFSTGGGGADTYYDQRYALWIGKKYNYGSAGERRSMSNALLYVRSDGKTGINADAFLGGDPLSLPSGNGYIQVKPREDGLGGARVFCSVAFSVIGVDESANCAIGAALYLVPAEFEGPGPGPVRPGVGIEGNPSQNCGWYGNMGDEGPYIPGGHYVCGTQIDSRSSSSDVKSRALQGSVVVYSAGYYKVFLALWEKRSINGSSEHGCFSCHAFAMQVNNNTT